MNQETTTYTVMGLWDEDEPVALGVIEGEHQVGDGDPAWAAAVWAEFVDAPDPEAAWKLGVAHMAATELTNRPAHFETPESR